MQNELGPAVERVDLGTDLATAGARGKPIAGSLAISATAVAIQIVGDVGYWIVRAREPQIEAPDLPNFRTTLDFSKSLVSGDYDLAVSAVAEGGAIGPPTLRTLHIVREGDPEGRLVISLSWSNEADLDLRVVIPSGVEISKGNSNSFAPPAPGEPFDPKAWEAGGILDFDSNAKCLIDARNRENIVWKSAPMSGHYVVRIDAFAMCAATNAPWSLEVRLDGAVLARSRGSSVDWDTRYPHDEGAGVLAAEFDVP
jgi:hypothetical protein